MPRYAVLDGMRGLAALAIVVFHYEGLLGGQWLPGAYLAVDFFFLMSGFVLAHASGASLGLPGGRGAFLAMRAIRLWPLHLLGTALFLAYAGLRLLAGQPLPVEMGALLALALLAVLFLPAPAGMAGMPGLYPLNLPAWSLALEVLASAAYGLLGPVLTRRALWGLAGAGAAGMVLAGVAVGHMDQGADWATAAGGLARLLFGFFAGVALHGLLAGGWRPRLALPAPLVVLLLALAIPAPPGLRWLLDLALVFLLFPWLLVTAAAGAPSGGAARWHFAAGRISYALYVLHIPVLLIILSGWRVVLGSDPALAAPWSGMLALAAVLLAAQAATALFDEPLRRALRRRLARRARAG